MEPMSFRSKLRAEGRSAMSDRETESKEEQEDAEGQQKRPHLEEDAEGQQKRPHLEEDAEGQVKRPH